MNYQDITPAAIRGSKNNLQRVDINTIAEKRQLRQQLQTLLIAIDRLEVEPRQSGNKFNALLAVTLILESQK